MEDTSIRSVRIPPQGATRHLPDHALAVACAFAAVLASACAEPKSPGAASPAAEAVTITRTGRARAVVVVMTEALATKERGPAETVRAFGEAYAFVPAVFAVHREEPTAVTFWNLQGDDEHDFMLADSGNRVLMKVKLPPLQKATWILTFHQDGLFRFWCTLHRPEMSGQIIVLPPRR
jgi:plastocyanin